MIAARQPRKSWSRWIVLLKFAVAGLVLFQITRTIKFEDVAPCFRDARGSLVGIALLLLAGNVVLISHRWSVTITIFGVRAPLGKLLAYNLMGLFLRQVVPFSLAGDGARIWLCRQVGLGIPESTVAVVLDRGSGVAGLLLVCFLATIASGSVHPVVWYVLGSALLMVFVPLLLLAGGWWVATRGLAGRWTGRAARTVATVRNGVTRLGSSPAISIKIVALSVASSWMALLALYLVAKSVGSPVSLLEAATYFPLVLLAAFFPFTVGGWGIREGAMVFVFSVLSFPAEQALASAVIFGALSTLVGLGGAPFWLLGLRDRQGLAPSLFVPVEGRKE